MKRAALGLAAAWKKEPEASGAVLCGMLRAAAAARLSTERAGKVDVVITGPSERDAPTRSTEAVVVDLVNGAQSELLLVTFAAFSHPPLTKALSDACARGVAVVVVLETVAGAAGLLAREPADAFAGVRGIQFFEWPPNRRGTSRGRLHAKLVVVDRKRAFVTSANLTGGAMENNLECGLLVHGGSAPERLADHFAALRREGVLVAFTPVAK
jgi:phosphatidylserine/phosphatidylglycerophosphate/cardiolipin synthase-like enzyme